MNNLFCSKFYEKQLGAFSINKVCASNYMPSDNAVRKLLWQKAS